jgi:hypothetical protein
LTENDITGHGEAEIERFLSHLATADYEVPSTQNQAFNALLFLYEKANRGEPCLLIGFY